VTDNSQCESTLHSRVLTGSFVLLTGSALVTAINFGYNVAVARFLGPTGFGHATAVYTLLILLSGVTLSFQIVTAKLTAQQGNAAAQCGIYRGFHRNAWACSIAIGIALILFRALIASYLRLPDTLLVVLLAIALMFYIPLGTRRGYLQGTCSFPRLAANLVSEGLVRFTGSLLMIKLGFGVDGVIAANAAGVATAYLIALPKLPDRSMSHWHVPHAFGEALQAIIFFAGQAIINNCDIVLVKHFFAPEPAGCYAVVALVGRVVFFFSWAVVNSMFPVAAGARAEERKGHRLLGLAMLLVSGCAGTLTLAIHLVPARIWMMIFGGQFAMAAQYGGLSHLLTLYAATTMIYALSVVVIAYEMSYKIANTGWAQLLVSGAVITGIYLFHSSLEQVIRVQLVMMFFLLIIVVVPFLLNSFSNEGEETVMPGELRRLRRVAEDEVMAEFLKTDFNTPEFAGYQETLKQIVNTPNLADRGENALRRALLFIRHGSLWRELPKDTEWYEVEIRSSDLARIRAFPRAQWRKLAKGDFSLPKVVRCIGEQPGYCDAAFLAKIQALRGRLKQEDCIGAVLLIGVTASGPFTLLDGNHRMVAAMLSEPAAFDKLRFYCALSPRMVECCWYETNLATLFRYGRNLLRNIVHDPEAEIERLLQSS